MIAVNRLILLCIFVPAFGLAANKVPNVSASSNDPDAVLSSYILVEADTGQVLEAKNPDEELPPASITKLMTAYLVFQALEEGRIHLDDMVTVSANARAQEGSRMFLEVNTQTTVNNMLQGLIVQSGNDAATALAEYVGGDVAHFVMLMNQAAQKLGMSHTHYENPTGLPDSKHYSTARDISVLARVIIKQFPNYYHYYSQKSFTWNKITQPNRNRLLFSNANVDGLKTGYTDAAGYCLVASEHRGNLRMLSVALGAKKEAYRYSASQALLNQGFAKFIEVTPLKAEQVLSQAQVWKGKENSVNVMAAKTLRLFVPVAAKEQLKATVQLNTIVAPLTKGQQIGVITITDGQKTYATVPAVAGASVEEAGFFKRQWHALKLWWNS